MLSPPTSPYAPRLPGWTASANLAEPIAHRPRAFATRSRRRLGSESQECRLSAVILAALAIIAAMIAEQAQSVDAGLGAQAFATGPAAPVVSAVARVAVRYARSCLDGVDRCVCGGLCRARRLSDPHDVHAGGGG